MLGLDAIAGEDLAHDPAVYPEPVAQLVDGAACLIGVDERLGLLGVELMAVPGAWRLARLARGGETLE